MRITNLVGSLNIGKIRFKAWPLEEGSLPMTAQLSFKIPNEFIKQIDPTSLFRFEHS